MQALSDKTNMNLPTAVPISTKKADTSAPDPPAQAVAKKGKSDEELLNALSQPSGGDLQANFAKFRAERARVKKMQRANTAVAM